MAQLEIREEPILKNSNNEPVWPFGIVGSISHSGNIAVAAVTYRKNSRGIGIDVEKLSSTVSMDIVKRICLPQEENWIKEGKDDAYVRLLALFSAKESVFKAFFPQEKVFLNFRDAYLKWDEKEKKFSGVLLKPAGELYPNGYFFDVGCKLSDEYVLTYLALPR